MSIPASDKTIACQDLVGRNTTRIQGHLRRRTKIDEFVGKIIQNYKWSRNFVVVSNGFVYCYNDETSNLPSRAVSLYGFSDCSECSLGEMPYTMPWVFKLNNALNHNKSIYLAAASLEEMKKWLKTLTEQITKFNSIITRSPKIQNDSDTEPEQSNMFQYDELNKDVQSEKLYQKNFRPTTSEEHKITHRNRKLPKPPVSFRKMKPPCNEEKVKIKKNIDETSPIYQRSSEYIMNLSIIKSPVTPPPKKTPPSILPKPSSKPLVVSKPTKAVKPFSKISNDETKTFPGKKETIEYELSEPLQGFWEGNVKAAESMLMLKKPGTFLIRLSKSAFAHFLTLMIKSEHGLKKYQIFKTNQQYHLEKTSKKKEIFDSVDELIEFYKDHQILSKEGPIFLLQPYNA